MNKQVQIACEAADRLPLDALLAFQGKLKHIIDGHQRLKVLRSLAEEG